MTRPILINAADRARLRQLIQDEYEELAQRAIEELESTLYQRYGQIFRYFNQSGVNASSRPQLEVFSRIERRSRGFTFFSVTAVVTDGAGATNRLYYLLSKGRRSFTQRRTSPPILERGGLATLPNTLQQPGFQGFTGNTFVILAGTRVGAIPPRNWDELLGRDIAAEVRRDGLAGVAWDVKFRVLK